MLLSESQRVFEKHSHGHGADASGDGSDIASFFNHAIKVHIALNGFFGLGGAYINHNRTSFDHISIYKPWFADRDNQDIGLRGNSVDVCGLCRHRLHM